MPICATGNKVYCSYFAARNAIVVIIAAAMVAVWMSQVGEEATPFSITGNITAGLPPFKFPDFTLQNGNHTITTIQIFGVSVCCPFFVLCVWLGNGCV